MTREEQLACLKDRPCNVCKMRTEHGCNSWECVFEQMPDEEKKPCDCISREYILSKAHCCCDDLADYEPCCVDVDDIKSAPSVKPKTDVLDKIRAEIKEESKFCPLTEGLERALEIIDKYTAEKE